MALLAIAFPKLRILWTRDPHRTVELFVALKQGQPEVDTAAAMAKGLGDDDELGVQGKGNAVGEELLQRLPGVSMHNYRKITRAVDCLADLFALSEKEIVKLIGPVEGKRLFNFINQPAPV